VLPKQSLPWLTILLGWSIECSVTDKITSNRESTNTSLNSSYSASNGSEKKPNHSTFNSFPLSNFHHQFLESHPLGQGAVCSEKGTFVYRRFVAQ